MDLLETMSLQLQSGNAKSVKALVGEAIETGCNAHEILEKGLLSGMQIIGVKFKNNEVFVPEVLVAARAMNMGIDMLKPLLKEQGIQSAGKVCIGTVQGDLHDIGKNLVRLMMEGKGLEVLDLGTDIKPSEFVEAAIQNNCQVICCSALLTTTMHVMKDVIQEAKRAGIYRNIKIMVGGAPVTQAFCDEIGADGYSADATSAANKAVEFCRQANA